MSTATWAHSWHRLSDSASTASAFVTAWDPSTMAWKPATLLQSPNAWPAGDVFLDFERTPGRQRFVFVAIDLPPSGRSIWFGKSNDVNGNGWSYEPNPVMVPPPFTGWDYPSVGINNSGRIAVGAVQLPGDGRFYAAVSTNGGVSFSVPVAVHPPGGAGLITGKSSRLVAAGDRFHAFIQSFDASTNLPVRVERYESLDGVQWFGPYLIAIYMSPRNDSPGTYSGSYGNHSIFYAPRLDARGGANGTWTVVFPFNNQGYNNIFMCTSDRGCGIVNSATVDQFLGNTAVAVRNGTSSSEYWVSYLANNTLGTRNIPLILQGLFFAPGANAIGATVETGIDPTTWIVRNNRCPSAPGGTCYAAGDFATMGSNPYAAATLPFVKQSQYRTDLFQSFVKDPVSVPNLEQVKPNFVRYPVGSDLRPLGKEHSPDYTGDDPRLPGGPLDHAAVSDLPGDRN